ncbi:MAG: SPFH domain-containing protein [Phycisphaerales bacterium]
MKADHLSFSRAANVCLLGLLLQAIMGLAVLVYAVIARDPAGMTIALQILCGGIVWVGLAVVFDQHRRERIEALEAETLNAQGGRSASVFESSPDDLRVAARRLTWMHRFMLPVLSVILASAYLGIGLWRFFEGRGLIDPDKFAAQAMRPELRGWAIAIGLGLGVLGFIFARFVSGMAKQSVWGNLRGGAAAAVGAAVMGLILSLAHIVQIAGADWPIRYLQVVAPGLMMFLGAEIVLNILLNLYRPRRAGEIPRPAMDSRVLAFVASPDRLAESIGGAISYQFGVDVTGSWAYRLLSRSVLLLVLVGAGVVWLMTCMDVVQANERAIRVRNGVKVGEVGPGLYFKLPWPFETLDTQEVTRVRRENLATPTIPDTVRTMLWTNDHAVEEVFAVVQPSTAGSDGTEAGATGARVGQEVSLLAVEVPLRFRIGDYSKFEAFATPATRQGLLTAMAKREVMSYLATCNEDDVLGRRVPEISAELRRRVQAKMNELGAGVLVESVAVESAHPTKEAAKDFESVVESIQKRAGKIEQGRTEAIRTLTSAVGSVELAEQISREIARLEAMDSGDAAGRAAQEAKLEEMVLRAGGKAATMIAQARADRWTRHMTERGRAEALSGQIAAYRAAPRLYQAMMYFDSLRDMMKGARVYITSDSAAHNLRVPIDLKDVDTTGNIFMSPTTGSGQ